MKNGKFLEQRQLTSEEGLCYRQWGFALVFLQFLAFLLALFFLANAVDCNYLRFFGNVFVTNSRSVFQKYQSIAHNP
jgi:hypothetical protein